MTLDKLPVGQEAVITRVGGEGVLRCRFLDMGLIPKTRVLVRKTAPMGDPLELRLRGVEVLLQLRRLCSHLNVCASGADVGVC